MFFYSLSPSSRVFTVLVVFTSCYIVSINNLNEAIWNPEIYTNFGISQSTMSKVLPTLSGLTTTLLFSICPTIFKFLSDFEGESSSMEKAEQRAMIFFWYFYICTRFLGQILWDSIQKFTSGGKDYINHFIRYSNLLPCSCSNAFLN